MPDFLLEPDEIAPPGTTREKGDVRMPTTVKINPELYSLIPPLSVDEYAQLEANILQDGCRDPLIIWEEEATLLDGHHRRTICEQHGLAYTCQAISLPDLDAAKAWMITNQLGRRNLTPEQTSYYRGGQYNLQKRQGKRTDVTSGNSYQKSQNTATELAQVHKVAEKTIRNDSAYARDVDVIAAAVGPEARQSLLARETKVTKRDVRKLAQIAKENPQTGKHVLEAVTEAKTPALASQVVQRAHREQARLMAYGTEADLVVQPERVAPTARTPALAPVITFADVAGTACEALDDCIAMGTDRPESIPAHLDAAITLVAACEDMLKVLGAIPAIREALAPAAPQEPAPLLRERDYCIVHLPPSRQGSADVDPCSLRGCPQGAHYRFWTHQPRPTGPVWINHGSLCPAHTAQWCLAHQVDIQAIPTITFAEWHAAATAPGGDYDRLPWFRFAAQGATAKRPGATTAPRAGTLIMRAHKMVKQLQPCTNAQVAKALGTGRQQAFDALRTLVKQGKVRKDGQQYVDNSSDAAD
jgi:hypothetical protein